ncbi:hypothetical protein HUJ04_013299 [Dendroctonus ponderosae]|uniref:DNA polymerase epsilon subunit n=1 Tax=Dendroctonus ponderosae TaxID=77166 RepID=A0AAR5Q989_DENPD|nr:hypothetical protein HUJ04_013299 [Dendroctonus ponderosae]
MANLDKLKKKLQGALKLSGFSIRREFCSRLVDSFLSANVDLTAHSVFEETVKSLCSTLEVQCLSGQSIEKEHIDRVLEVCLHSGYDHNETVFSVINAFDFPKLFYNPERKLYLPSHKRPTLLADADSKTCMFLDRYTKVLHRTKRTIAQTLMNEERHRLKLQTVDYLLTISEVTMERTLILGSLLQTAEGKFALEDPTGLVNLDLTHAEYRPGFYLENSLVLVTGYYEDKVLHVSTMIMPTGEDYVNSRPAFGNLNYFGGKSATPLRDSKRLKQHLVGNPDEMFVFLSDVWLDHPQTFHQLEKLFGQMEQFCPPIAFVFLGDFMSESHGSETLNELRKLFKRLTELILRYSSLVTTSQFVFVPGLGDPCTPHIAPRLALPNFVTDEMGQALPNAIFASNPCRIQYCTKEIVVFRADVLAKFLQGTLYKPAKQEISKAVTRTIIGQGHLCPVSLNALNVHWDFDYCMSLYPLPDLVVIGDKSEAYKDHYKNCIVMNPGQFCTGEFGFKMYYPAKDIESAVEDCAIDEAETEPS